MAYAIDEIRRVPLGGVRQKIHIRGEKPENPVLLFLHGGPGISNRDGVMTRDSDLCDASRGISGARAARIGAFQKRR